MTSKVTKGEWADDVIEIAMKSLGDAGLDVQASCLQGLAFKAGLLATKKAIDYAVQIEKDQIYRNMQR